MKPCTYTPADASFTLLIEYDYTPGDPGRTYGPVEQCYEGWPEEIEITSITMRRPGAPDQDVSLLLASELCEEAQERLMATVEAHIRLMDEAAQEPPERDD